MNLGIKFLAPLALGLVLLSSTALGDIIAVPPMVQVSDLTGTLSAADQAGLETKVQALEHAKGAQLAVLIVPTTGDEDIEQYAHRVFETWHLGRKGVDDGVLLIIAKTDKHLRIEVGRGLEGAIPDISAKRIGSDVIAPLWKKGGYSAALNAGVDALGKLITEEALPAVAVQSDTSDSGAVWLFICVLLGVGGFGALCLFIQRRNDAKADRTISQRGASLDLYRPDAAPSAAAALATRAVLQSKAQSSRRRSQEDDSSSRRTIRRNDDDSGSSRSYESSPSSSSSSDWSGGGGGSAGGGASSDL